METDFNFMKAGCIWLIVLFVSIVLAVIGAKWDQQWVNIISYILFCGCMIAPIGLLFFARHNTDGTP